MHCTSRRGASIARMRMASLNRLQRSGPDCRPRHGRGAGGRGRAALPQLRPAGAVAPHRRVPAQRSAAEGVATGWSVARRRGRSLPAGASFALAERLRCAGPPTAAPLASGPLWWHAGVEGLDDTVLDRPESGGGFGAHFDPRPSEDGAVQPPRLPGPGTACCTACASSPPALADPSIVTAYLLANEAAVLSGGSGTADGGFDGVIGMQVDDSRNQDGNCTLPPSSGAPLTGSGGGLVAAASEVGGSAVDAAPRGPRRLLALSSHVFAGTVALTVDRDIRRPGWQEAGGEAAPPAPSAAEMAEGRQWLRSQFRPWVPVAGLGEQGAASALHLLSGPVSAVLSVAGSRPSVSQQLHRCLRRPAPLACPQCQLWRRHSSSCCLSASSARLEAPRGPSCARRGLLCTPTWRGECAATWRPLFAEPPGRILRLSPSWRQDRLVSHGLP
ncbi:unnamed protein product [Prorocentrum cordatum]|uniref:Uncharacterized protein n=1 Tax=Prorocentrum cordatum TaxID=2364126 RepID=A0ABN9SRJ5_9DINO|nr:unnamed protein product [Polarella glacialis]